MEGLHQVDDIIAQRYRILDILGQGGVGITYKAQDLKSGQQVALKALSLRQMGDWKILELFEREAKILAQLNHPAIPRYLDYFQLDTPEDRSYYIAQEVAEGKSLAALAEIGWRTNESGVRRITTQILEILVYLHSLKPPVVHRDIKPQNLIWGQNAKVFLVDFGAVQDTYRSTFTKGSTIVGTYGFMAPEQFLCQAVPATDLYGLGATILFLLTHRSPSDLPLERLKISFRSRIQVSEGFANWLEKMLEPDVEDRFSSAQEALEALRGRRAVATLRFHWSVPWTALVGVGVVAVAVMMTVLNSFKWVHANIKDSRGRTPLHYVSSKEMAEQLIAKGADVNARAQDGETPLHSALRWGNKDIVELLIAKGADVNARDKDGKTLLHSALDRGNKDIVKLLIAKGADVNAKDNNGKTLLHSAALSWGKEDQDIVKLLIAKGADVNARDKNGTTPLHSAALSWGNKDIVELLITKGADVNAKDNNGSTPLQYAASVQHLNIIKLLKSYGGIE